MVVGCIAGGASEFQDVAPYAFIAGDGALTAPLPPTIVSVTHTKVAAIIDVGIPNDPSAGMLQLFAAADGTASNPDSAPNAWKKIHHTEIDDDVAAGRPQVTCTINRPGVAKKAIIGRIKSRYDHSLSSPWSAVYSGGTVPGSDDTSPGIPVLAGIESWVDDIPGTPGKEASAQVTVACTDNTRHVEVTIQNTRTGKVHHKTVAL